MIEALAPYAEVGPAWIGFLLFPLGLVAGSFSSVLLYRLPRRQSIVWPGSRCTTCGKGLKGRDLVPLVSWLLLRGQCRHCAAPVPWKYPALELVSGVFAAVAGFTLGWGAGFGALLAWVLGTGAIGLIPRRQDRHAEAGLSLVEVLIAAALLVAVAVPMLDFGSYLRGATAFQRQIAVSLASSKMEELGSLAYRTPGASNWPTGNTDWVTVGLYSFTRTWTVGPYPVESGSSYVKQATVIVTCDNCSRGMQPVRLTGVLAKVPQS